TRFSRDWSSDVCSSDLQPELSEELTNSFCRTDPEIAKHFARVTFLSDNRKDVRDLSTPTLILQSDDDLIAPVSVGEYLHAVMPKIGRASCRERGWRLVS